MSDIKFRTPPKFPKIRRWHVPTRVYVVACCVDGFAVSPVKVGISKDVETRFIGLQSACPIELCFVWSMEFPDRNQAIAVEYEFHDRCIDLKVHGEWRRMAPDVAIASIVEIAARHKQRAA